MGGCGEGLAGSEGVSGDPPNCEDGLGDGMAEGGPADEKDGFKFDEGEGEHIPPGRPTPPPPPGPPNGGQGSGDGLVTDEGWGDGMLLTEEGRGDGTLDTDEGRGDGLVTVDG